MGDQDWEKSADALLWKRVFPGIVIVCLIAAAIAGIQHLVSPAKHAAKPATKPIADPVVEQPALEQSRPVYAPSPSYDPGPSCKKGCRCGNSCIDCSKTCHK